MTKFERRKTNAKLQNYCYLQSERRCRKDDNHNELGHWIGYAGQDTEELESRLERVRRLFEKLPEKQKEVVFKCCIEGKLYRETAQEMQISENTVKTHLLRAMKFFRQELRGDILLLFMLVKRRLK